MKKPKDTCITEYPKYPELLKSAVESAFRENSPQQRILWDIIQWILWLISTVEGLETETKEIKVLDGICVVLSRDIERLKNRLTAVEPVAAGEAVKPKPDRLYAWRLELVQIYSDVHHSKSGYICVAALQLDRADFLIEALGIGISRDVAFKTAGRIALYYLIEQLKFSFADHNFTPEAWAEEVSRMERKVTE